MPQHDSHMYLYDSMEASNLILEFTAGKTFEDYKNNPMMKSAVERQFEIIGEALGQAVKKEPSLGKSIQNISRIVAFRNRLIHGYAHVSDEVVWGVVEKYLPILRKDLDHLLKVSEP